MVSLSRSSGLLPTAFGFIVALVLLTRACIDAEAGRLTCGVCEAFVDEVNDGIQSTTKTHAVQTRFRIDEKKRVSYARTEHNLLEIMEGDAFIQRFAKYGIVKPNTKTAKHMKRAYELLAEGREIEPLDRPAEKKQQKKVEPTATPTPASSSDASSVQSPSDTIAAATVAATSGSGDKATSTEETTDEVIDETVTDTPPVDTKFTPYRPVGELPISLRHNHVHLVRHSTTVDTGLVVSVSSAITSEIKSSVEDFLEEYLDEAMLMFHREVPELKQKLCVELTEACQPIRNKQQRKDQANKNKGKDEL